MAMTHYREVELTLDALDLLSIESLVKARIEELQEFKAQYGDESIPAQLANEQLSNYRTTLRKIRLALREMKAANER